MSLLDETLIQPSEKRLAFIEETCAGDKELKSELIKLLNATLAVEGTSYFERLGKDINPFHSTQEAPRLDKTYGQYTIKEMIGQGGMGIVYLATDNTLQRQVALKFLPEHLIQNTEGRRRFLNEARAAAALDHPNICTIFEINEQHDTPFIAMAYVSGQSLKHVLKKGPLEISEVTRLSIQVCEGLDAAHSTNIIHRDIKPANLMISKKGRLIIMDFGLAKLPGTEDLSKSGTTRGTIAYMSPEQARGREVDPRSDLWSLGVVMYNMLTGKRPFSGKSEYDLIQHIIHDPPAPIEQARPEVPRDLREVIYKLLSKKPRDRYLAASDVLVELRKIDSSLRLRQKITRNAKKLPSIAVLPFVNMSSDSENEFFCEGLAEELINGLCNLSELRVAARTSSFAFKNKDLDVREIGQRLQVEHLLEGSVRKAGDKVRIVVQLIKIEDGYHLWSHRYDRVLEDVFAVQDELTLNIVEALKVKLLGEEKERLLKHATADHEAYTTYLKSRFYWNRRTQADLEQAALFSVKALEMDPGFANAYSCLADSYVLSGLYGYKAGIEIFPRAKQAAERALELNPDLAEAFTSLGVARVFCDWDWYGGERACRRALSINSNYPTGHSFFAGFVLAAQGRLEEATNEINIAQHLDPLSFIIQTAAGIIHWQANQHEKAFDLATSVIESTPWFWLAHALRGLVYEQWEQYSEAIEAFKKAIDLSGTKSSTLSLGMLGHSLARAGQRDEAEKIVREMDTDYPDRYVSPYDKAIICTGLNEYDNAFSWLEKSVDERSSWSVLINVDPRFGALKGDPRFETIMEKMQLK